MLSEEEELTLLQSMLASARTLAGSEDPLLQGYFADLDGHYWEVAQEERPVMAFTPDAGFPMIYAEKGISNLTLERDVPQEPAAPIPQSWPREPPAPPGPLLRMLCDPGPSGDSPEKPSWRRYGAFMASPTRS